MADEARFAVRLIDKVTGNARRITGGANSVADSLNRISDKSVGVAQGSSKMDKALKLVTFAGAAAQAGYYTTRLVRMLGGVEGVRRATQRTGAAIKGFGRATATTARRVAPFAVGAAGIYGIGKVAGTVAIPAISGLTLGLGGLVLASGAAAAAVGFLAFKVAGATGRLVTFGQNSRLAFDRLAKHGASGAKLFDHARSIAAEFGLDVLDTSNNFRDLLAKSFNPKLATDIIKMGADLRVVGAEATDVKGAIRAIGQIKAAGRLQGDEINQLSEAGIGAEKIYKEIGRVIGGKTVPEVLKLKEAGKIDQATAITGILEAVRKTAGSKELGDAGRDFANNTISGMLGQIKARGQNVGIDLAERIEQGATKSIGRLADSFFKFIESAKGKQLIDDIGRGVAMIGAGLEKAVPLVRKFSEGFGKGAGRAFLVLGKVTDAVAKLGGDDPKAAERTLRQIGESLGYIVVYGASVVGAFAGIAGGALVLGNKLAHGIIEPIAQVPIKILGMFNDLKSAFDLEGSTMREKGIAIGKAIVSGIAAGITGAAKFATFASQIMAGNVVGAVAGVLKNRSPSRVMKEQGWYAGIGLGAGWVSAMPRVESMVQRSVGGVVSRVSPGMGPAMFDAGPSLAGASPVALSAGGFGGGAVSVEFGDIIIQPPAGTETPEAYGTETRRAVRREVEMLLTELALQT